MIYWIHKMIFILRQFYFGKKSNFLGYIEYLLPPINKVLNHINKKGFEMS